MNPMRALALLITGICLVGVAWAESVESGAKHPGYVDVDMSQLFGKAKPNVSLDLDKQMLQMASGMFGGDAESDDGVNDGKSTDSAHPGKMWGALLGGGDGHGEFDPSAQNIDFIRVRIYDLSKKQAARAARAVPDLKAKLIKKNWQQIVLVEETDETVVIYVKKNDMAIQGLLILVIEPGEGVFVNLAGTLDLDMLKQLSGGFSGGTHAPTEEAEND